MSRDDTAPAIRFIRAETKTDFDNGETLFRQYIQSLDFELTFQDVDREMWEIAVD